MFVALTKTGSTLEDITRFTEDYDQESKAISFASGDALYLGARLKFNHAFIKLVTASPISIGFTVSLYDGQSFVEVGNLTDSTDGLTKDGFIEFAPKKGIAWSKQDSLDVQEIKDIQHLDLYWLKIEVSQPVDLEIGFIGHKFSNDYDLFSERPELNNDIFKNQFNQSDFEKQAIIAATIIDGYLIKHHYADSSLQVLTRRSLKEASIIKVAEIIYASFGQNYIDEVALLKKEFLNRITFAYPIIDKTNTAEKSQNRRLTTGTLCR